MSIMFAQEPVPMAADADGVVRIGGTRVTLDTVISAFLGGATAEEIVHRYPSLKLADVYSVLGYYLRRRSEIDSYLAQRQAQDDTTRRENERRFDPEGIRQRLLARQSVEGR